METIIKDDRFKESVVIKEKEEVKNFNQSCIRVSNRIFDRGQLIATGVKKHTDDDSRSVVRRDVFEVFREGRVKGINGVRIEGVLKEYVRFELACGQEFDAIDRNIQAMYRLLDLYR